MSFLAAGAIAGAVGGIIQGVQQKSFSKKQRRRNRKGQAQGRTAAELRLLDILEGEQGPAAIGEEGERTGSLFSQGRDFLSETFGDAAGTPLAQDFIKQIRAAQAARGTLFGGAAINTEASGLAAFSQNLRAQLLPQLQQFAFAPEQLRQNITSFEVGQSQARVTGQLPGQSAQFIPSALLQGINSGVAGAFGGAQVQSSFDSLQLQKQNLQLQRDKFNAS